MTENVEVQKNYEFLGTILYVIGAVMFCFIPLVAEEIYFAVPVVVGLVLLIAGFILVIRKQP